MRKLLPLLPLSILILSLSTIAEARAVEAYTTRTTSLRTGPDLDFPRIERVGIGTLVDVFGCIEGYRWCDVDVEGERGWISGQSLEFTYDGRTGSIDEFAPLLGLMILNFSLHDYWDQHYQQRPWYTQRNRQHWENWQPHERPTPFGAPMQGHPPRGASHPFEQVPSGELPHRNGTAPVQPDHPEGLIPNSGRPAPNQRHLQQPQNQPAPLSVPQRGTRHPYTGPTHKKTCLPPEICP